jgi:hypothetical protein
MPPNNLLVLASLARLAFGGGFGALVAALMSGRRRRLEIGLITALTKRQHASKTAEFRSAHTRAQAELVKPQRAWRQHVEAVHTVHTATQQRDRAARMSRRCPLRRAVRHFEPYRLSELACLSEVDQQVLHPRSHAGERSDSLDRGAVPGQSA